MWFKHSAWIPIAWLLSLANLVAVWFAAQPAQPWHATIHALLAILFGVGAKHLALRKNVTVDSALVESLRKLEARLANPDQHHLTQALDAMAVEVERIGEGQRYLTKLFAEREAPSAERAGASTPPDTQRSSSNPPSV